jgi:hypothetical protein
MKKNKQTLLGLVRAKKRCVFKRPRHSKPSLMSLIDNVFRRFRYFETNNALFYAQVYLNSNGTPHPFTLNPGGPQPFAPPKNVCVPSFNLWPHSQVSLNRVSNQGQPTGQFTTLADLCVLDFAYIVSLRDKLKHLNTKFRKMCLDWSAPWKRVQSTEYRQNACIGRLIRYNGYHKYIFWQMTRFWHVLFWCKIPNYDR